MIDLNEIAWFVEVVRRGSFAEAGRHLGTPSNTLSRRVQQLEARLGTRLLQRSTRKLTLTAEGEAFHARCAGAVAGLLEAGEEVVAGSQEPRGLIRVAAPADFFEFFPMAWVAAFLARHRKVRIDFVLSDARADLITERIDVAFRGGALEDSSYVGRQLIAVPDSAMFASPAYLDARGMPRTLADLGSHDCILADLPPGKATWRLMGESGEEAVQVAGRFSANTAQALRRAAVEGLGIAVLSSRMAMHDLQAGRLVPVLSAYRRTGRALNVLYPSRRQLSRAVAAFIEDVARRLTDADSLLEEAANERMRRNDGRSARGG